MSQSNLPIQDDKELLTAYLDGELSDSETMAVEQRLGTDEAFHAEMKSLQQAWDLLDNLPSAKAGKEFVRTTMELAVQNTKPSSRPQSWSWLPKLALAALLPLCFAGSFFYSQHMLETPERELTRDLGLIENLDRYASVIRKGEDSSEGIRFLKEILNRDLISDFSDISDFDSESLSDASQTSPKEAEAATPASSTSESDNKARFASLSSQKKIALLNKKSQFDELDSDRQETLRQLHEELLRHPNREKLEDSLASYYHWLKTLGMGDLADFKDSDVRMKLLKIRSITAIQTEEALGQTGSTRLGGEDARLFHLWYDMVVSAKSNQIRNLAGEVHQNRRLQRNLSPLSKPDLERLTQAGPIGKLVDYLIRKDRKQFANIIINDEIGSNDPLGLPYLHKNLSPESRKILYDYDFQDQQELVLKWIETANANRTQFTIQPENLQEFHATLSNDERDELDNLHPNDWHSTLEKKYRDKFHPQKDAWIEEEWEKFLEERGLDWDLQ